VRRQDRESLLQRLRDQEAIEGIGVVHRQIAQQVAVAPGEGAARPPRAGRAHATGLYREGPLMWLQ
jgi:hypothetical protein